MRESTGGSATDFGGTEGALAAMSTALWAQQIPPMQKFDEWLEQFELVAGVCRWDKSTKLVNLVTRLKGEAYGFYKSCIPQQRGSYSAMVSALTKRFTPVQIQAVQTSLFHERRQSERETVARQLCPWFTRTLSYNLSQCIARKYRSREHGKSCACITVCFASLARDKGQDRWH